MKMSLQSLLVASEALKKLSQADMPIKAAFKVAKILKAVQAEMELFDAQRKKMAEKYGQPGEQEGVYQIKPEHIETVNAEMKSLLEMEVDLAVEALLIDELGDIKVAPGELIALELFIQA